MFADFIHFCCTIKLRHSCFWLPPFVCCSQSKNRGDDVACCVYLAVYRKDAAPREDALSANPDFEKSRMQGGVPKPWCHPHVVFSEFLSFLHLIFFDWQVWEATWVACSCRLGGTLNQTLVLETRPIQNLWCQDQLCSCWRGTAIISDQLFRRWFVTVPSCYAERGWTFFVSLNFQNITTSLCWLPNKCTFQTPGQRSWFGWIRSISQVSKSQTKRTRISGRSFWMMWRNSLLTAMRFALQAEVGILDSLLLGLPLTGQVVLFWMGLRHMEHWKTSAKRLQAKNFLSLQSIWAKCHSALKCLILISQQFFLWA